LVKKNNLYGAYAEAPTRQNDVFVSLFYSYSWPRSNCTFCFLWSRCIGLSQTRRHKSECLTVMPMYKEKNVTEIEDLGFGF